MAEQDSHYNHIPQNYSKTMGYSGTADSAETARRGDYGLTTPLPDFEEGGPVADLGNPDPQTPVIPLPDPEEGGAVAPNSPADIPTIPLPNPEEGLSIPPNLGNNTNWLPIYPVFPGVSAQYYGQVRFLNASTQNSVVNLSIDGVNYAINSRFGTISNYDWISDGFHTITVRSAYGMRSILLQQTYPFSSGQKYTLILVDSASGGLSLIQTTDSGCNNLPYNTGCFRFANMSYGGSQVDLVLYGGETIFRNVAFESVTPYKQAVAGTYQFYVAPTNSYSFIRELPILLIGAVTNAGAISLPLLSFQASIQAGKSYTTYLIGNTWSSYGLKALTVSD